MTVDPRAQAVAKDEASGPFRLAELIGGLTLAADLVNGFPPEKVLRTVLLAVEIGRRAGFGDGTLRDAYYVTLFRFLGCTGFAHEEAAAFGAGDDIATRNAMALADVSEPGPTLRGIVAQVGRGAPLAERARAMARLVLGGEAVRAHAHAQCEVSVQLARVVGMSDGVVRGLSEVCERYDGRGEPNGLDGSGLSVPSQLLHLADAAEIALHRSGVDAALGLVRRRSGKQLDPTLCGVFEKHGRELCDELLAGSVWQRFLAVEPAPLRSESRQQANVALAFARFVDLKSVFTLDHSTHVAELATRAAELAGLDRDAVAELGLAAHLHDLGRVSVPNRIWDKPGPLDLAERERVRLHAYYTERILARGTGWARAARLASAAHERVDAGGYHRSLPAAALGFGERLLAAADVLAALLAARPHRPALAPVEARDVLRGEVRAQHLDASVVDALIAALDGAASLDGSARLGRARPCGLSEREVEVLRLVAVGKSNQEAALLLRISPKTVKNHVANVYAKIGVYSRAGAALFAAEHGLL
jgi:HD-GYP domain-containing protein (c-di-GMP phosphodiesterase class II)